MKSINHIRHTRKFCFYALAWGLAILVLPKTARAQCTLFFTNCPPDITITDCDNSGTEPINWPLPLVGSTGGCENFYLIQTLGPAPGTVVASPGVYTITYVATAINMNNGKKVKASCSFQVHVEADNTPPVFTYCPPDITLYTGNETTANGIWVTPFAEDNCGPVTLFTKIPCNTPLKPGVHLVKYKAVDAAGNAVYCSFTVTVILGFQIMENSTDRFENTSPLAAGSWTTDIVLSPNPFKDRILLSSKNGPASELDVRIFDMQGRERGFQKWKTGANTLQLETSELTPGVFYIKITSTEGAFVRALRGVKM